VAASIRVEHLTPQQRKEYGIKLPQTEFTKEDVRSWTLRTLAGLACLNGKPSFCSPAGEPPAAEPSPTPAPAVPPVEPTPTPAISPAVDSLDPALRQRIMRDLVRNYTDPRDRRTVQEVMDAFVNQAAEELADRTWELRLRTLKLFGQQFGALPVN
jgi:hypothetical protein